MTSSPERVFLSAESSLQVTRERSNYAKLCALLVDGSRLAFRNILINFFPTNEFFISALAERKNTLQELKNKDVISQDQWDLLYHSSHQSTSLSSTKFDASLLFVLLRHVCDVASLTDRGEWLPDRKDLSREADIGRLILYRNGYAKHSAEMRVSSAKFEEDTMAICEVLVRLGGQEVQTETDQLYKMWLDPELEKDYIQKLREWQRLDSILSDGSQNVSLSLGGVRGWGDRQDAQLLDQVKKTADGGRCEGGMNEDSPLRMKASCSSTVEDIKGDANITKPEKGAVSSHRQSKPTSDVTYQPKQGLVGILKEELKFHYNKLRRLQPMPWMKRVTVDLGKTFSSLELIDRKTRYESRNIGMKLIGLGEPKSDNSSTLRPSRINISREQIFSPFDIDGGNVPRRILMEGEPGIGKTTLCKKLAHDWRNDESYINRFSGVFVIDVRKFKGSLKLSLREQGLVSKAVSLEHLWEYIAKHQNEFLWIIDGLDELYPNVKDDIVKLVTGQLFPDSTVLASSRICQWEIFFKNENLGEIFDREITNAGFVPEASDDFMKMYFESKPSMFDASDLLTFVKRDKGRLRDLTRNPLICMYLCFLWEDKLSRDVLKRSEYLDFCQVLIRMRKCVSRRFFDTHKGEKLQSVMFEDRVQKVRHLAFDGLMRGKTQFSLEDINSLFTTTFNDDDTLFQMGILSKELGEVDEIEVTLFEFPHKAIQDELAGEYFNSLSESERETKYDDIVSVPARHQMLVFMSALSREIGMEKLTPLFDNFKRVVDNFPYYQLIAYDPFNEPNVCLPLECLSVSGCSQSLATILADVYMKRGKALWFLQDTLLTSYEDNIKGLICLIETTKYADVVEDVVISGWSKDKFPAWALHIIRRLATVKLLTFIDVPYSSMLEIVEPDFVSKNPVEKVVALNTGLHEKEIAPFHKVVAAMKVSDIVDCRIYNFGSEQCVGEFHFLKGVDCSDAEKVDNCASQGMQLQSTNTSKTEINLEIYEVQDKPLNLLCSKFDFAKLQGKHGRISISNTASIANMVDILKFFQSVMSSVQVGVTNVLEKAVILIMLEHQVIGTQLQCQQSDEYSDFISDVTVVQTEVTSTCKWLVGIRRQGLRSSVII
ncbi:uncharacterized protein LOC144447375 [Glandiceps talaboti]